MDLEPHVDQVQEQLRAAAALGDERTIAIARACATAAAPALRLAILGALSEAAHEITAALLDFPGSPTVAVRMEGDHVSVDVQASAVEPEPPKRDDGDANARISLRLSDGLKADIEAAAEREGVSVNTWLVRVASGALRLDSFASAVGNAFSPSSSFAGFDAGQTGSPRRNHHITGWING